MTLTLGRITDLGPVDTIRHRGDQITINGRLPVGAEDLNAARWMREQIRGLVGNVDEPTVPLLYEADPWYDGMVAVDTADVDVDRDTGLKLGHFPWSFTATRVPSAAMPWAESILLGAKRTTDYVLGNQVDPEGFWWTVPAAATEIDATAITGAASNTRTAEDGDLYLRTTGTVNGAGRRIVRYTVAPADWYVGSAEILYGDPLAAVVGRQIPTGLTSTGWKITNRLIEAAIDPATGILSLRRWLGATWSTWKTFAITDQAASVTFDATRAFAVLHNTPASVGVRVGLEYSTASSPAMISIDLTLRRGAAHVDCRVNEYGGGAVPGLGQVRRASAETAAALNLDGVPVGAVANVADADGLSYWVATPVDNTLVASPGGIQTDSILTQWSFGVGLAVPSGGADGPEAAAGQYLHPYAERITIVGR